MAFIMPAPARITNWTKSKPKEYYTFNGPKRTYPKKKKKGRWNIGVKVRTAPTRKYRASPNSLNFATDKGELTTYSWGQKPTRAVRNIIETNQSYRDVETRVIKLESQIGEQMAYQSTTVDDGVWRTMCDKVVGGTANTYQQDRLKICLEKFEKTVSFTNCSLAAATLQIYQLDPRFPHNLGPRDLWDIGIDDMETANITGPYKRPYSTPFQSQMFTTHFNVKKVFRVELAPGQVHTHKMIFNFNKLKLGAVMNTYSFTCPAYMYVVMGSPANDVTTKTSISTSQAIMNIVEKDVLEFTNSANTERTQSYTSGLNTIGSGYEVITNTSVQAIDET